MSDINDIEKIEFILRREPKKIYSINILLILTIIIFLIICYFVKYPKEKIYIASVILEKDYIYLTTNITKESMENLETSKLFIDKNSYDFNLVQFEQRNDNNYTVTIQIDGLQIKENQEYVVIYLKEKDTTLFEELKKKLKEVFNEET